MKNSICSILLLGFALAFLSSCDSCKPKKNNWSEADKYQVGRNPDLPCGDSLFVHLSAGDSLFVKPNRVIALNTCHVEMSFSHFANGSWQSDEYVMGTERWKILHDSTNIKIKCTPVVDNTCGFMLRAKKGD